MDLGGSNLNWDDPRKQVRGPVLNAAKLPIIVLAMQKLERFARVFVFFCKKARGTYCMRRFYMLKAHIHKKTLQLPVLTYVLYTALFLFLMERRRNS